MGQCMQCRNLITVSHENQRYIPAASFVNKVMERIESVLNTILKAHYTYISQQIRPSSFQLRLRRDQLQVLQIRPIAYYKYLFSWAATPFDSHPSLR